MKLTPEIKQFLIDAVRKEVNKNPEEEQFKSRLAMWVGAHPDEFEELTALQAYDKAIYYCREGRTKEQINNDAAPYFFRMLLKDRRTVMEKEND